MENWPSTLQQLLNADDFDVKFGSTTVRSSVDVGPAKVRSRFTNGVDTYSCSIFMDIDQYSTFENFYKTLLANGSQPFTFANPLTQTTDVFRFASDPEIKPLGGRIFRVSMAWEKLP